MRMFVFALIVLCCSCRKLHNDDPTKYIDDDLEGPVARPASGYGADGPYTMTSVSFASPTYAGKQVTIFYPKEATGPVPVIFYSHPYGGEESSYNIGLYNFIAKKGYAVVFAPYPTTGINVDLDFRYNTLWQSFMKAVTNYPDIIDTKKVGFMGHSFGGGASFAMAYKGFVEQGWGENGRFIFTMAQWYSYWITDEQLQSYPENTKFLTQVYNDDVTNDHRMAIDIYKHIKAEKNYMLVKESVVDGYTYTAAHDLPSSRTAYDAYDYYVVYRLLDAMIDYSFNGHAEAKNTALGNGSAAQVNMPQGMTPLIVTDNPVSSFSQGKYLFPCGSSENPRLANCE